MGTTLHFVFVFVFFTFFFFNFFLLFVLFRGFLTAVASLVVEHRLQDMRASVFAARGLSSCGSQALEQRLNS